MATGLIVRNARVHPTLGDPVDPADVLVEGDRIEAIRPAGAIPSDGRPELDAEGRLLVCQGGMQGELTVK